MKCIANKHIFVYPYNGILLSGNLDESQMPHTISEGEHRHLFTPSFHLYNDLEQESYPWIPGG